MNILTRHYNGKNSVNPVNITPSKFILYNFARGLFYEGNSGRAVGRIMGISKSTVYNWIKKLDKKLQDSACAKENNVAETEQAEIIEMDELFDYVEAKKRTYVITLVTRKPRQVVGLDVAYDKSENRMQKIVGNSIKAKLYYSDANPGYQKVSYNGQHFFFRDKSHTFTVESVNSDICKYITALQRKSKCFFFDRWKPFKP